MKKLVLIASVTLSLFFVSLSGAYADGVSKQKAAHIAQGEYPGRVIDVKLMKQNGQLAYRVKVLDKSGSMHIVIVSQATGDVLSSQ
jgi:uncharacterized membrane protein YkoI